MESIPPIIDLIDVSKILLRLNFRGYEFCRIFLLFLFIFFFFGGRRGKEVTLDPCNSRIIWQVRRNGSFLYSFERMRWRWMGKLFCIQSAWSTGLLLVEFCNEKQPLFTRRFVSSFFRFLRGVSTPAGVKIKLKKPASSIGRERVRYNEIALFPMLLPKRNARRKRDKEKVEITKRRRRRKKSKKRIKGKRETRNQRL